MFKLGVAYQSSNTETAAGSTTAVLTKPSGVVDGDLLITVLAYLSSGSSAPAVLSGWTALSNAQGGSGGSDIKMDTFYKIASSEPSSYTWTFGASTQHCGVVIRINGQDSAGYIDASETGGGNVGGGTSLSFGSGVTPSRSNDLLLQCWATTNSSTAPESISNEAIATSNPSWTEACDLTVTNAAVVVGLAVAYANRTQTTLTGSNSATAGAGVSFFAGTMIALRRLAAFTASIIDTVTDTDNVAVQAAYKKSIQDTVTPSDSVVATKGRAWSQDSKNTNTGWTQDPKS